MIEMLIFHAHIVGALYGFTKRWQEENIKEGLLAVAVIGLVFMIGWAITGPIAKMLTPKAGFPVLWFTTDTLSLLILLPIEAVVFKLFFFDKKSKTS